MVFQKLHESWCQSQSTRTHGNQPTSQSIGHANKMSKEKSTLTTSLTFMFVSGLRFQSQNHIGLSVASLAANTRLSISLSRHFTILNLDFTRAHSHKYQLAHILSSSTLHKRASVASVISLHHCEHCKLSLMIEPCFQG